MTPGRWDWLISETVAPLAVNRTGLGWRWHWHLLVSWLLD